MPPAKSSRNHDDSKPETTGAKEKSSGHHSSAKMRRNASQQGGSNLREVTNASAATSHPAAAAPPPPGLQWSTFDRDTLHTYCREHNLNVPSCFTSTFHQTILSRPGSIGAYSPTMLRRKKQRQNKEHLTRTVRKHFNGLGIQENDVIVDFIYKLRSTSADKTRGPIRPSLITPK